MPANKVGIIGGGNVGQTLGRQLAKKGRTVVYGSRNPGTLKEALEHQGLAAEALTVADAVSKSDILILAVPGEAAEPSRCGDWSVGTGVRVYLAPVALKAAAGNL